MCIPTFHRWLTSTTRTHVLYNNYDQQTSTYRHGNPHFELFTSQHFTALRVIGSVLSIRTIAVHIIQQRANTFPATNTIHGHRRNPQSTCDCEICINNFNPLVKFRPRQALTMNTVEAGSFIDELYCLKKDFALSNLPPVNNIKTVRKPKTNVELKVAHINLFDVDGEITVLELWNEDALRGVAYLWKLLNDSDEVLLRFKNLESVNDSKEKKSASYKLVPPTSFMQDNYSFSVKARIIAQTPMLGQPCDLSKQCKHITLPYNVQLLCDSLPIRHYSHWHRTLEDQQEDDNPDELQKLIHNATEKSEVGKRRQPEATTTPDKGFVMIKNEEDEDSDGTGKKVHKVNEDGNEDMIVDNHA